MLHKDISSSIKNGGNDHHEVKVDGQDEDDEAEDEPSRVVLFARPHSQADDGSLAAALSPFVISQPGDDEDEDDDGDENDNIGQHPTPLYTFKRRRPSHHDLAYTRYS